MPTRHEYESYYREPSFGWPFEKLLSRYATFNIKSPYETISIPTAWLIDPRLNDRQKIVLLVLNAYADKDGAITITTRQLQVYTHSERKTVINAMSKLQELGYIERIDGINGARPTYKMLDPTPKVRKYSGPRKNKNSISDNKQKSKNSTRG